MLTRVKGQIVSGEGERTSLRKEQAKQNFKGVAPRTVGDIVHGWDDWSPTGFEWWSASFAGLEPPPDMSVSEWADKKRKIPPEFAAEPGDWDTARVEYMRAVMDACSPSSTYKRVVLVKPTQSGGTESAILNTVGHTIDLNPRSMLIVFPTVDLAQSFAQERLEPMIMLTPSLKAKVSEGQNIKGKTSMATSSVKKKRYPGGFLNMVSPAGLTSRPVPIVIMDEVDDCIKNASGAGDPTRLLAARTTTFFDRKEIFLSSPSNEEDETGIIQMWQDSTQGVLETRCPNINCHTFQTLEWERMDLDSATLQCEKCGENHNQWSWQSQPIRWTFRNPEHPTTIGFWMSGLNSPWLDWANDIITEFREASRLQEMGDESLMRVWVNTKLARTFRPHVISDDIDLYNDRREVYSCHLKGYEVPDGVLLLTAAVDVQDKWLAYEIVGWGRGRESWGIEYGDFQGDPRQPGVWDYIDRFIYRRIFIFADGTAARIRLTFVDSGGHCTTDVYKYCKLRSPRMFPVKGVGDVKIRHPIIIGARTKDTNTGVWLIRLGVDGLKDEFHSRLAIESPGPGYCHWPQLQNGMPTQGYNEDYFEQLLSERRVLEYDKHGFVKYKWAKNRLDQNESFDLRCYNRAALEYLKVRLEAMPCDIIKNFQQENIEKIDIGLGRSINVERKLDDAVKSKPTRANTVSSIGGFGQEETPTPATAASNRFTPRRRTAQSAGSSRYGSTTMF